MPNETPAVNAATEQAVRRRKLAEIENAFSADLEMRMLLRYDIEGLSDSDYEMAKATIFSEPPVDNVY